jgi:hypothetical protein
VSQTSVFRNAGVVGWRPSRATDVPGRASATRILPQVPARNARWIEHLVVLTAYLLSTLLMTYPVALSFMRAIPMDQQINGWYPGDGDPWHYLWGFWYFKRAFSTFPLHPFWTDLVFYPIGFEIPFLTGVGAILFPAALLATLLGVTVTYNIMWILSFVLAGYSMYLLVRHLVGDRLVAFFCGEVFAFSTYRMIHALEHLPILLASFLVPLFALALFKVVEEPTTKRWVLCAVIWAVSAGISWYCTISLFIYLAVFGIFSLRRHWPRTPVRCHLWPPAMGLLALVLVAAPFVLPLMASQARDSIVNRPLGESSVYAADLLAFFVPSPRHPVWGRFVEPIYQHLTGNPYEQTVYLGYILLALSVVGALRSSTETTRMFVVMVGIFFVLALGPFLHVYGRYKLSLEGEMVSVPLPGLLLHYIPFLKGMRAPSRFTELLVFSLTVLAGYGLSAIRRRLDAPRSKGAVVGLLLLGVAVESAAAPFPALGTKAPAVYSEMASVDGSFTVMELPLDWRIIKYHYYQTIHGKRLLVGHPVRTRDKYVSYPAGLPLVPFLKEPKLLLQQPVPPDASQDAERLAAFFDIRYVVIHRPYLDPAVFERLDRFVADHFRHVSRTDEGEVVAYALRRPRESSSLWPDDYRIDFGSPTREFALLTGWAGDERWGDLTVQWSDAAESSMHLYLNKPVDRDLELRLHPFTYEGLPPQTVAVYVNGRLGGRLTLERTWAQYQLKLPVTLFRTGLNAVTFKYGYAVSPARLIPGSADTRMLAVAFDYVTLRQAR